MIESLQHVQYQKKLFIIETSSYKYGFYAQFENWDLVYTLLLQVSRVLYKLLLCNFAIRTMCQ
jgi:hypothetical protein